MKDYIRNTGKITRTFTPIEDKILTLAIDDKKNYGPYRLLTHNCQHWVNDVVAKYHVLKG